MKNLLASQREHTTIILVESNPLEREKFSHISLSEAWRLVVCEDGLEVIQWLTDNSNADLLVIEENSSPISGYQIADYIKSELGLAMPVIISTGEIPIKQESRMLAYAEAILKKPFAEGSAILQIRKILENSIEISPEQNDYYSLEYLSELSGGDKQFIQESIELFSATINTELRNLKEVLNQKDYLRIREIAHGIKPSFEMLENETGRGICHLLNSGAKETEMSSLIDELNLEFINITNQLSKDFPELNIGQ
ncbi:response regulator receiver domain-containing protein [Gillisia sp. Hel_I_86]|uniref:response regulator transcription factor n=1 Tax=Gillisia sp. Hel_I_86 TaxID=1249981 RepID=UPI0011995815|nr:response regulator transcription factor [Gillisia sp. Hel_I_86]TVZ27697.1 response regulator receiver domain-containing protein [Gillisia sp. Hel_I_86]